MNTSSGQGHLNQKCLIVYFNTNTNSQHYFGTLYLVHQKKTNENSVNTKTESIHLSWRYLLSRQVIISWKKKNWGTLFSSSPQNKDPINQSIFSSSIPVVHRLFRHSKRIPQSEYQAKQNCLTECLESLQPGCLPEAPTSGTGDF